MEIHIRRNRTAQIQNQENVYPITGKAIPAKKQGLAVRGALGDLNGNVQSREVNMGKVANAAAEFEKKATLCLNRTTARSNYKHVQSKVDTGLPAKSVQAPGTRLMLRREESTASLATRAGSRMRHALKEINKINDTKESANINNPTRKSEPINLKKTSKLPIIKENKDAKILKPILKESTETLGKLKLADDKFTSLINHAQLEKFAPSLNLDLDTTPELPEDIENIDTKDCNSHLFMTIYIKDIYRYLTDLELKYNIEPNYLKNQSEITSRMRATLIDWLVEVQRQFSLLLETFQLTVGIVDRYLQATPNVQRTRLQLVGVTAMFIAAKYEEVYVPEVGDFVCVTDNAYTKKEIFECEREIMTKLGFCLAKPIPLSFLRRFVKAAKGNSKIHQLAKYFVDLSLIEYSMVYYRPSELAAAAVWLSLYLLSGKKLEDIWTLTMSYYTGYSLAHIEPIITKLTKIVIEAKNSRFKAVYEKYQDPSFGRVSALPQLQGEAIYELVKKPLA